MTPKREDILDYIRNTTLPLIDGTGDYNNNLTKITRDFREPNEFSRSELPAIVIRDDGITRYKTMTANEYETGTDIGNLQDGMAVWLMGVNKSTQQPQNVTTGVISQENNQLMADIILAMLTDTSLGGNCEAVTLVSSQNSLDWTADYGLAVTFLVFSINYVFDPTIPTI